jgi:DNA-binding NtrC family response regulator
VSRPYHVIIADDDDGIRMVLTHLVRRTYPAVAISAVADGATALQIFDRQGADLVITNQTMPHMSGLDLIVALRARHATVPIVMVSGEPAHASAALRAGATRFVAKPFTPAQIVQALTSVLAP